MSFTGLPDDPQAPFDAVEDRLAKYLDDIFGVDSLARQDFNSFYLSLLGMERNFVNLALNQVFEQIASGAETIDNPLQTGVISQLNYVESYFPSLYRFFSDIFGDEAGLDRAQALQDFGIDEDPYQPPSEGPTQKEITSGGQVITDKEGNSFIYYDGVRYVQDGKQWVPETTDPIDVQLGGEAELAATTVIEQLNQQAEEESGYLDYLQQVAEASTGLEPDADLMGTKDITGDLGESRGIETYFLDALELADFNAGNDVVLADGTVINNRTHEMTGTPGFGGGQLVTERDVVVEDEGGGGGGAEAAPQPQPETTTTADAGAGDTIFADEPSTGLEVGDGTDVLIEQLQEAIEAETDEATREDLETVLEGLEQAQAEQPEVVEQPQAEVFDPEETTTEAQEDEEDESVIVEIFTQNMPASDMVDVIIEDTVTSEPTPEPVPEPEEIVETPTEIPTETPTTPTDTVVETPVETPAEGQEQAGEAEEAGTDTGQVGEGQDGEGEGEGGEGVGTGLGGVGMFSAYVPPRKTTPLELERYRPDLQPFRWQLEEPVRLFDYIDYNPLRNIR